MAFGQQSPTMADFSDQFDKWDPLLFNAVGIFDMWPRQAAWEARALLTGRTSPELKQIALGVESMISDQVAHLVQNQGKNGDAWFDANPKTTTLHADISPPRPELLRESYGDVNLFMSAFLTTQPSVFSANFPFAQWEGLAVITLWKLLDFYDAVFWRRREPEAYQLGQSRNPAKSASALLKGAPLLVEAMRACTLATECKTRAEQLDAMADNSHRRLAEALYSEEAKRREEVSRRARAAVSVRHKKTHAHAEEAIRMANAQFFSTRAAAARHVADLLQKAPGEFYTVRAVDEWLKESGWKPKVNRPVF